MNLTSILLPTNTIHVFLSIRDHSEKFFKPLNRTLAVDRISILIVNTTQSQEYFKSIKYNFYLKKTKQKHEHFTYLLLPVRVISIATISSSFSSIFPSPSHDRTYVTDLNLIKNFSIFCSYVTVVITELRLMGPS